MDFQSVNTFNVRLNMISGNLLPMTTGGESSFSIYWKIYSALVWLLEITQMSILIPGCLLVSKEKALRDGMIGIVITFEVAFIIVRLHTRRKLVQRLIRKINDILCSEDELMHNIVKATLKSMDMPLKLCLFIGVSSVALWSCPPYMLVFKKDHFFYVDYKMPVAYGKEPISTGIFILGSLVVTTSSMFIFAKKVSADTYMIHLILLVTAQYRYIGLKLSTIIRKYLPSSTNIGSASWKRNYSDQRTEKQIKMLCRHHNSVLRYVLFSSFTVRAGDVKNGYRITELFTHMKYFDLHVITFMLKDLMSLNFSLIYLNNVFRFCSISFMLLVIQSMSAVECIALAMYASGGVVQLYLLCYCVQQLLDASSDITDKAFHEEWYQHGVFVKRIFIMMIMANSLEYRLSRFEKFNLSLPSFMTILNQSYSIALLLLKTT